MSQLKLPCIKKVQFEGYQAIYWCIVYTKSEIALKTNSIQNSYKEVKRYFYTTSLPDYRRRFRKVISSDGYDWEEIDGYRKLKMKLL